MKIAFFSNSYFPITYGSTVSVENFRLGLEELGHEIHIFTPNFRGYKYEVKNIHLYPAFLFGYKIKYPIALPYFHKIREEIKEGEFDIIHAQHPFSIGVDAMKIAKEENIPLVFTHHAKYEDFTHYVPPIIPQKLLKYIVRSKVRKFANNCDVCISPSETTKSYMRERGIKARIKVLPTGIDWQKFQEGDREGTRKKLGIKADQKVIMFLGRIENEKNIMFLVGEIFPLLKKDKKIVFLFVGEGSLMNEIKQIALQSGILEQLIFTGIVKQSVVANFYATTDIFVHASLTETQGMTIAEAMASGLPIVAVKASGVVDQLKDGETGIMVDQKKGVFGEKITKMLSDSVLANKFGKAARRKAKEYDNKKRSKTLESVYLKIKK